VRELDVSRPSERDIWLESGLEPGGYSLRVQAGRNAERAVRLESGDRLVVRLVESPDGRGIAFDRALYADDFAPLVEPFQDAAGWRLSVPSNRSLERREGGSRLEVAAILEPVASPQGPLRSIVPRWAFFELVPQTATSGSFAARWRQREGFPAPLWQVEVPLWVADSATGLPDRPALKAWWLSNDQELEPTRLSFTHPRDMVERAVAVGDRLEVVIDGIDVEEHSLEVHPGSNREVVTCLVVRLRHPGGSPFFVDPDSLSGLSLAGYEHRFYKRANAYTGLFYPVSRSQVDETLRSLNLLSLARLKRIAEDAQQTAALDLKLPRSESRPPELPPPIRRP
jgi:hypothetical protein